MIYLAAHVIHRNNYNPPACSLYKDCINKCSKQSKRERQGAGVGGWRGEIYLVEAGEN